MEHNATINSKDRNKHNVMYDALSYGNEEIIDYLLTFKELELNNLDIDNNSIFQHKYIQMNAEIGMKLIERGADPTIINNNGSSFLYDCAKKGIKNYHILLFAIEKGFNINAKIRRQWNEKLEAIKEGGPIDWQLAEAFASTGTVWGSSFRHLEIQAEASGFSAALNSGKSSSGFTTKMITVNGADGGRISRAISG